MRKEREITNVGSEGKGKIKRSKESKNFFKAGMEGNKKKVVGEYGRRALTQRKNEKIGDQER